MAFAKASPSTPLPIQTATSEPTAFTTSAWMAAINVTLVWPATFKARVTMEIIA